MKYKGELALITSGILYGFVGVFTKLINFQIPLFYQAWVRNAFAVCVVYLLMLRFGKWKKVSKTDFKWFFLRSVAGFIGFVGIYISFTKLDIGTTYFFNYAGSILMGYVLGIFLFKERLTRSSVIALMLGFIGLFFIYRVNISVEKSPYVFLAFISGIAGAGWGVFSKKLSASYDIFQVNFVDTAYAALFPFIVSLYLREPWIPIAVSPLWVQTFLFAFLFICTGYLTVYGFSRVDAQTGMIILLIEIVAGITFGYLFFKEMISIGGVIGGIFIVAAMVIRGFSKET